MPRDAGSPTANASVNGDRPAVVGCLSGLLAAASGFYLAGLVSVPLVGSSWALLAGLGGAIVAGAATAALVRSSMARAAAAAATAPPPFAVQSPDGRWWWDGSSWRPLAAPIGGSGVPVSAATRGPGPLVLAVGAGVPAVTGTIGFIGGSDPQHAQVASQALGALVGVVVGALIAAPIVVVALGRRRTARLGSCQPIGRR